MTTAYFVKDMTGNQEEGVFTVLADAQTHASTLLDNWIANAGTSTGVTYRKESSSDNRTYVAVSQRTLTYNFNNSDIVLTNVYEGAAQCYCVMETTLSN